MSATPLLLNGLLEADGFDLSQTLVFRHRPWEPALNKVFDTIVAERRDLFDCYQSTHAPNTEAALGRATHVVSFIRYKPKKALFVGLYEVFDQRTLTVEEYRSRPLHRELMDYGMSGLADDGRRSLTEFTMRDTGWHCDWSQRLVIDWPGLERSWYRWADRNHFPVSAIAEEPLLLEPAPDWRELSLGWDRLRLLPSSWQAALAQWRGVYLIIDQSDRMQYVGSASGQENLLQRWRGYAQTGHGGNKLLRGRDPNNFVFSILQLVAPALPSSEVVDIERSWKERLRTRAPSGLNEN